MSSKDQKGKHDASLFSLNESAAQAFSQIAQYMELKGVNPFKIKAYIKALRVLRDLEEDLDVISNRNELRSIPGVGKAIADKLESFLETGKIPQLEELKEEIPAGLVLVSSLPGLGAKKTVLLHKELGVSSLQDLKDACLEERVETVKGFSKKSQSKFLGLVEKALQSNVTFVKSRTEEWGRQTCERLVGLSGLDRAVVVGRVRRRCPFSDKIEILLICHDVEAARQDVLHRMSQGANAAQDTEDGLVLSHPSGCPIHIYFHGTDNAGWEMMRRTGPQEFLEKLGEVEAANEEDAFAKLGRPFVTPELRELEDPWDVGQLLQVDHLNGNLHAHTTWSDGADTLDEMVAEARRRGHQFFGVSDHSRSLVIANGLTIDRLRQQGQDIRKLDNELSDIKIFRSVECDILEKGELDYPDDVLDELDYVVAAVHSFFHLDKEAMTYRLLQGISHAKVRVLAHPTGRRLTKRDGYSADWEQVFAACAKKGVALEINASPWRLDISEELLRLAIDLGCLISINTDAHSVAEFDYVRHGVDMARRVALHPDCVINTWSAEKLAGWF